jgi:hypothetical protein
MEMLLVVEGRERMALGVILLEMIVLEFGEFNE